MATALATGAAVTFTDPVGEELEVALKASSSMPFFATPQMTTQGLCLDGGLANSIPFNLAQQQGYDKIVVVRTRPSDYRKKPSGKLVAQMFNHSFADYPAFVKTALARPTMYNEQVAKLNALTAAGQIFGRALGRQYQKIDAAVPAGLGPSGSDPPGPFGVLN